MKRLIQGLALLALVIGLTWLAWPIPLPPEPATVRVLDRHGVLIAERAPQDRSKGAILAEFPEVLKRAVLAAEDHRFYTHPGVDPVGVARAALANLRAGRIVQGGSTITQQLARTLWPRPPGLRGKLWEAAVALRLEVHLSKAEILNAYLNRVYVGNLAYGLDAAARFYLDKPATALSTAEAATLAAMVHRPAELDPWRAPEEAVAARDRVLDSMEALGWLDAEAAALARDEALSPRREPPWSHAPHFVRRVLPEVLGDRALESDGPGEDGSPRRVIRTTLDLELQLKVESLVSDTMDRLASRGATQAAVIVADTRTAEVLAYVGSAGWSRPAGQVDGARALRSPGSALKPFLYWLGLERRGAAAGAPNPPGVTLATVLPDLAGAWTTTHGTWSPQNYDRHFHGPVTARYALAGSLNLPAVRLLDQVGVADLQRRLQDLGVSTLVERPAHYGLGLALGGGELQLDELLGAYVALANGGLARPLTFQRASRVASRQVGDRRAAWLVVDALDDNGARASSFGIDSVLEADFPLAAKTGTSVGWRDNWAFGMNPEVTIGVWVGNFDGSPMVDVSGVTGAGPLLRGVAELAYTGARADFPRPEGLERARVCPLSGLLPGERCPGARVEWFIRGTAPTETCAWHQLVEVDDSGALATGCPGAHPRLIVEWPAAFASWAEETDQLRRPDRDASCAPSPGPARSTDAPAIAWPPDGVAFYLDPRDAAEHQAVPLRAAAPPGSARADWSVDGQPLAASQTPPFDARWVPSPGLHTLGLAIDGRAAREVRVWVGGGAP